MSIQAIRAKWEDLRELGFASISTNFTIIGTPVNKNPRIVKIINDTDQSVYIGFNGISRKILQPANSGTLYDLTSNATDQSGAFEMSVGDAFYVRAVSTLPTSGIVAVEVVYASTN